MSSTGNNLNVDLEHIINKVLIEKNKKNDRDYSYFHASEFHQCHRKLVYKYYEAQGFVTASNPGKSVISPRLQRIFDNGHHLHFRLGRNFADSGLLKGVWKCSHCFKVYGKDDKLGVHKPEECSCGEKNFQYQELGFVDEETLLGGHVDAVLDLTKISNGVEDVDTHLIVDFKSISSLGFQSLASPKADHVSQLNIYMYFTGLHAAKLLYENKNNQEIKEFFIERNEEDIAAKIQAAKNLKNIVTKTNSKGERTLPARAHKRNNSKECVECSFRSHCWDVK